MSHRWMFEVLDDLETYARSNGLPRLAAQLSQAAGEAVREISAPPRVERAPPADPAQRPPRPRRAE